MLVGNPAKTTPTTISNQLDLNQTKTPGPCGSCEHSSMETCEDQTFEFRSYIWQNWLNNLMTMNACDIFGKSFTSPKKVCNVCFDEKLVKHMTLTFQVII